MIFLRKTELTGKNFFYNVVAPLIAVVYGLLSATGFGAACGTCSDGDDYTYEYNGTEYTGHNDDNGDNDDDCSGCNIMSGGSGTWGIGVAMVLPVLRFAISLMRERVNKAKHVMISQGLDPASYLAGSVFFTVTQMTLIGASVPIVEWNFMNAQNLTDGELESGAFRAARAPDPRPLHVTRPRRVGLDHELSSRTGGDRAARSELVVRGGQGGVGGEF